MWENTTTGRVYICVGNTPNAAVWRELVQVTTNNSIVPAVTDQIDLGTPTIRFQDLFLSGGISAATNIAAGGTLNVTGTTALTGTTTASTINAINVNASSGITGILTGSLVGNVTGNVTGNVSGNITSSGTSTFTNIDVNGGAIDGTTIGLNSASTGAFTNLSASGTTTIATADVNGGAIDGTTIGAASKAAASFTTVTATGQSTLPTVNIDGGTIDGTTIGNTTPSSGAFTTVTSSGGITGALTGNVTGNLTGNVTGDVDGNVTGDLTGNVTAASGSSTFNNVTIDGTLNMNAGTTATIQNLTAPTNDLDAATKKYVDDEVAGVVSAAPAALDTLNELAAALGDDANFSTTITNSIATKLPKAGGTMSGEIAMGSNKITGAADPTGAQDVATKAYTDTQRDTRVAKTGDSMSGALAMGNSKITGLATPTAATDATNKTYVDGILGSATVAATSASNAATSESNAASFAAAASNSSSAAATSENNADTSEANALTYSSNAATSAAQAASSAAGIAGYDLDVIAESKAVTAVDVFVYDTSNDTDGGKWRKRTQGTSWYQEALNTATRGNRREFPAVAVIVAEDDTVTIYDGDDPALPMWMVFEKGGVHPSVYMLGRSAPDNTAVASLNGVLAVSLDADTHGEALSVINFVSDSAVMHSQTNSWVSGQDISGRNNSATVTIDSSVGNIVNRVANDVAMTVLPDAPIDPATGLPVPTIAVATAGGVSVIKDDGTVVDSASTINTLFLSFSDEGLWYGYDTAFRFATYADILAGDGFGDITASTNGNYALDLKIRWRKEMLTFGNTLVGGGGLVPKQGFEQFSLDYDDFPNSMKSETTSTFNTGWQQGDIKGAFLSSTDTTSLTDTAGELVTNGTFDTDTTGWTPKNANTTLSVVGNQLSVSTDGETGYAYQAITTVAGQTYRLTGDADETTGASYASIFLGATVGSSSLGSHPVSGIDTGLSITFVATSTTTYITLYNTRTTPVSYALFDNISVVAADADRSVNNNGLIVNGTITRTPVATGADLVGYSGFSASNYLEQPYNSDLDFGTGDFSVMGWVKMPSSEQNLLMRDIDGVLSSDDTAIIRATGVGTIKYYGRVSGNFFVIESLAGSATGQWAFFCVRKDSGNIRVSINANSEVSQSRSQAFGPVNSILRVGARTDVSSSAPFLQGSAALLRISATAPSAEQIAKIYSDEKVLFQENAQATLYGTSDAVTALSHDDATDLLHVGTNAGRSVFQGLRRVSNTTTVVATAISASNGLVVEE
jgi:hypothetical protein